VPRLAYASRSCCTTPVSGKIATFAVHKRMFTRAAGVSPPWFGKRTCQYASAKSRESFNGAITNPGGVAVANPRAAYVPRSCVGVRMSAGEIAIFAVHKRMFSKSGGRQPAVVRESHLQWRSVFVE
jgi:hypothetical protein